MTFLYPQFLWALIFVAIPIIIHLLNLRKYKTIYFSHTKFIEKIQEQKRTKTKLKEIIILLLRILAITFLVLAFAQPVKFENQNFRPCKGVVTIFIDNSLSMTALNNANMPLLENAKLKAYQITKAFDISTKFYILSNDFLPEQHQLIDYQATTNAIANISQSPKIATFADVIEKLKNLLNPDTSCSQIIFYISDFQKFTTNFDQTKIPQNWKIYLIPIQTNNLDDLSIDSVSFFTPYHIQNRPDSLAIIIRNASNKPKKDIVIKLTINDSLKSVANINLEAKQQKIVKLSFVNTTNGWQQAKVSLDDPFMKFDNQIFFSFYTKGSFNVLIISNSNSTKYLTTFYSEPPFYYKLVNPQQIPYSQLEKFDAIILNSTDNITSGTIQLLKQYLQQAGNLIIFPNPNSTKNLNKLLSELNLNQFQQIDTSKHIITWLNTKAQIYQDAILSYEPNELMPKINLLWLRKINFAQEQDLLRDEKNNVLLSEIKYQNGKIYLFSFPLDTNYTDFHLHPLFVPTMFNTVIFSQINNKIYYTIGKSIEPVIIPTTITSELVYLKKDNQQFIPPMRHLGNFTILDLNFLNLQAGTYDLIASDSLIAKISFNYNRKEAKLNYYTPEQLHKLIKSLHISNVFILKNKQNQITTEIKQIYEGKKIWKIFVILALVMLLLEIIINRLIK